MKFNLNTATVKTIQRKDENTIHYLVLFDCLFYNSINLSCQKWIHMEWFRMGVDRKWGNEPTVWKFQKFTLTFFWLDKNFCFTNEVTNKLISRNISLVRVNFSNFHTVWIVTNLSFSLRMHLIYTVEIFKNSCAFWILREISFSKFQASETVCTFFSVLWLPNF